jgi:phosphoglycerate dehydrogenase-like enzyme
MTKAIFLNQDPAAVERVYGSGRRQRVEALLPTRPGCLRREDLAGCAPDLTAVEVVWSTWGMPTLADADFACLPKLRAVFYAAGTVRGFAPPLLERGITLCSAWRANALPVAEATLAHILLALKQTWAQARAVRAARDWNAADRPPITGAYGATVGLIALGAVGRRVVELLRPFDLHVLAYDPFAPPAAAAALGVELVSLEDIFRRADVVSVHAPWLPQTEGMIGGRHLEMLKPHATFINTARGAVVREGEMIEVLCRRPDVQAILDVVYPEPPVCISALYDLPNVLLTPHIAGSMGNEVLRMTDWMIEECTRYLAGEPLRHQVTPALLATMA